MLVRFLSNSSRIRLDGYRGIDARWLVVLTPEHLKTSVTDIAPDQQVWHSQQ